MTDEEFLALARRNAEGLKELFQDVPRCYGDPKRIVRKTKHIVGVTFNTMGGMIIIGENCFFGHEVMLLTGTHDTEKLGAERIAAAPSENHDIIIEEGVWIASRAIVLGPARIGRHAVVAAGAVVRGNLDAFGLYAGNPAAKVREVAH